MDAPAPDAATLAAAEASLAASAAKGEAGAADDPAARRTDPAFKTALDRAAAPATQGAAVATDGVQADSPLIPLRAELAGHAAAHKGQAEHQDVALDAGKTGADGVARPEVKAEPTFGAQLTAVAQRRAESETDSKGAAIKDAAPAAIAPAATAALEAARTAAVPTDKLYSRVGTPAWDQQLGQKVIFMAAGGEQSATMELNPPDLGPLQVVLSVNKDQATASFTSAAPEVRQALENAMPRLREMMSEAGIQLGNATVSAGTPDQQQGQAASAHTGSQGGQRGHGGRGSAGSDDGVDATRTTATIRRLPSSAVDTFA
jgi:flagellar hook-length control protein FliK